MSILRNRAARSASISGSGSLKGEHAGSSPVATGRRSSTTSAATKTRSNPFARRQGSRKSLPRTLPAAVPLTSLITRSDSERASTNAETTPGSQPQPFGTATAQRQQGPNRPSESPSLPQTSPNLKPKHICGMRRVTGYHDLAGAAAQERQEPISPCEKSSPLERTTTGSRRTATDRSQTSDPPVQPSPASRFRDRPTAESRQRANGATTRAENRSEPTTALERNQLPPMFLEPTAYSGNSLGNPLYGALEEDDVGESDDLFHGLTITVGYPVSSNLD